MYVPRLCLVTQKQGTEFLFVVSEDFATSGTQSVLLLLMQLHNYMS
jgi:hypothetical protein